MVLGKLGKQKIASHRQSELTEQSRQVFHMPKAKTVKALHWQPHDSQLPAEMALMKPCRYFQAYVRISSEKYCLGLGIVRKHMRKKPNGPCNVWPFLRLTGNFNIPSTSF